MGLRESVLSDQVILFSSAQNNGCSATTFHENCDNYCPLLVVVKNTDGYIFGGYTDEPWTKSERPTCRSAPNAFLFRLKTLHTEDYAKYAAKEDAAVISEPCSGPIFGNKRGEVALRLYSGECKKRQNEDFFRCSTLRVDLASGFHTNGHDKYQALNGGRRGNNIQQIEVFQVTGK